MPYTVACDAIPVMCYPSEVYILVTFEVFTTKFLCFKLAVLREMVLNIKHLFSYGSQWDWAWLSAVY